MQTNDFSNLPFSQCISKISIKHKIKQKDYLANGKYPVIDQGQSFISGYCDDEIAIKIKKPVIIFGDHTRCFKFVDFNFVAGADGIHILEPKDFFNEKLFYYFCLALDFPNKGYSRHFQYLAKTTMKIPPLEIQKRIVARLESAFEKIEKGSAHLQDAKTKLAKYKQSLLKSAFDGTLFCHTEGEARSISNQESRDISLTLNMTNSPSLRANKVSVAIHESKVDCHDLTSSNLAMTDKENPKLPQGWTIKTLGEIAQTTSGGTPSRKKLDYWNGNIKWLKSGELNDNYINEVEETITQSGLENSSAKIFSKGTLLIALYGATIGKLGILNLETSTNQAVCAIMPNKELETKYLFHFLFSIRNKMIKDAFGGAQSNISQTYLKQIKIPLPPLEIQKQIVKFLERHLQHADKIGEFIESALNKAKQLKQSLLKSAFLGKPT